MTPENRQASSRIPRPRRWFFGGACFAGLALVGYVALIGYAVFQSRVGQQSDRPITSAVAKEPVTIVVSAAEFGPIPEIDEFSAEAVDRQSLYEAQIENLAGDAGPIEDASGAAQFAARMANHECLQQWRRAPFTPDLYSASLLNGRWHWGHYDPAGQDGFSAEVSFERDGSGANVRINLSIDSLEWRDR